MISKSMQKAINEQMTYELYSAYVYMGMAAWFRNENLNGFANWMEIQAKEEVGHAMKFYHYLYERLGSAEFGAIEKPKASWKSAMDAVESAYAHEKGVTARIHKLVDLAAKEKDKATEVFLQWYVNEQVEEEASVDDIVNRMKLVGDFKPGLFFLDRELASREG